MWKKSLEMSPREIRVREMERFGQTNIPEVHRGISKNNVDRGVQGLVVTKRFVKLP